MNMTYRLLFLPRLARVAGLAALLATVPMALGARYESGGFESPRFEVGTLDEQDDWRVVNVGGSTNDAVVQDAVVYEGNQALQLKNAGNRVVARYRQVHKSAVYVDAMMNLPPAEAIATNAALMFRGRDAANKSVLALVVSFNGGGAVNDVPSAAKAHYKAGQWTRVTVKVDFETQSWSLWLNGEHKADNLPLRVDGLVSLDTFDINWTSKPAAEGDGLVVDNFSISSGNPLEAQAGN